MLSVPGDDSQFWNFDVSYISYEKYVDPANVDLTILDTKAEVTTDVGYFWNYLIKFVALLTCIYAGAILFIIIHNFDSDNDFEKRKRWEMFIKQQKRLEDGDESSEGKNNNNDDTTSKSSNSNSTTYSA